MLKKVIKAIKKGTFFKKLVKSIKNKTFKEKLNKLYKNIYSKIKWKIYNSVKIKNNKIIFLTYQRDYTCNPKYIAEYIIKQNLPYKLIWGVEKAQLKTKGIFPKKIKKLYIRGLRFFFEVASSKIIIDNGFDFEFLRYKKKREQVLIQTWHGSMGFKRIDYSSVNNKRWALRGLKQRKHNRLLYP